METINNINNGVFYTEIPQEYITGYDDWFNPEIAIQKYGDLLIACESHPVYFAYYKLGIKPRDYQVYELDMMLQNKKIFDLWGRRLGKSAKNKIFSLWSMWYNKYPSSMFGSTNVLVIAHEQGEADSYISDIREMMIQGDERVKKVFKGKLGDNYFTSAFPKKGENAKNNTSELSFFRFGKWHKIRAYPPTDRARGKGASIIILDEVAFWYKNCVDPSDIYYKVVRPVITDNPDTRLYASTTPDGKVGLAYELIPLDGHESVFKLIWMPYYYRKDKAYIDEMQKIEIEYKSQGKYNDFRQEYLAELVEQSESYFDSEKEVKNVFSEDTVLRMFDLYQEPCECGIDFGGSKNSRTVITVSKYDYSLNKMIRLYHKRYPVSQDSELQKDILEIARRFNITKWHIDNQGGGSSFYAWFRNTFGTGNIDEVSFRAEKEGMYRQFKIACYQDRVRSYHDTELYQEFVSFTRDMKPMKGYTDDMLDSFVMSCRSWLEMKEKSVYTAIIY